MRDSRPTVVVPSHERESTPLRSPRRYAWAYFLAIFVAAATVLSFVTGVFYLVQTKDYQAAIEAKERFALRLQEQVIARNFETIVSDLRYLSRQNELLRSLEPGAVVADALAGVATEYVAFASARGLYDQVRFIDRLGAEVVRVNFHGGSPVVVPDDELQDKSNRYYFRDTVALRQGEIFVSPLDLNVEQGRVERPLKPMIRFGTPIYDGSGAVRGAVILNYLGEHLLEAIQDAARTSPGDVMLVNQDGYWLGHPDPSLPWGFMIPERAEQSFGRRYPRAWNTVADADSGQFRTDAGLFTFTTIAPLQAGLRSSSGAGQQTGDSARTLDSSEYAWKVVSHIPASALDASSRELLTNLLALVVALLLFSIAPTWLLAQGILRRKLHRERLWRDANYDILTGLPNRALFHDRLRQAVSGSERYGRCLAVLYLDLDGFKGVNDSLGHDAGDRLLLEAAARMQESLRDSDTVARVGGDEFTVLLPHVERPEQAGKVAAKMVTGMARPFLLEGTEVRIGASVGIAFYPADGSNAEELVRRADGAMYWAKTAGRNGYRFCPPGPAAVSGE